MHHLESFLLSFLAPRHLLCTPAGSQQPLSCPLNNTLLPPCCQAANLTIPSDAKWTILAPTNAAFNSSAIKEKTGVTAAQLLEPANKDALVKVGEEGLPLGRRGRHVAAAAAAATSTLVSALVICIQPCTRTRMACACHRA